MVMLVSFDAFRDGRRRDGSKVDRRRLQNVAAA
jgi:hypothetical protein